jgi:hypothetical protein
MRFLGVIVLIYANSIDIDISLRTSIALLVLKVHLAIIRTLSQATDMPFSPVIFIASLVSC